MLYVNVCLLAFTLYVNVCLSRSTPCHALHPLWAYACWSLGPLACMVASVPLRACLDVATYEIHLCSVGVLDTHLSLHSMQSWYFCLACFVPPFWLFLPLRIFARLPTCSCMCLCVVLGHPFLFDNMLVCFFICLACFVCPHLALFVSVFFAYSSFFPCFFLCPFAGLFLFSLHVRARSKDAWSEGTTS